MYASSSSVNPTPLAHADTQRDVHPRGGYHTVSHAHCDVDFWDVRVNESNTATEDASLVDICGTPDHPLIISIIVSSVSNLS
ncbi:hypothetical protein TNCV_864041 [Trichonephila clavipes]|nr:hypothetical protein TNCV_864041 [Trichonephila clavipes]